jgi:hypothetical protein
MRPAAPATGQRLGPTRTGGLGRRLGVTIAGGTLCLAGIALLALPGPGLLVVLAGLVLLAAEYPWARRLLAPIRRRAVHAAEHSVASPAHLAGSVLAALIPIAAGLVWLLVPGLPFASPATSITLTLSGTAALALLAYSYRRYRPATDHTRSTRRRRPESTSPAQRTCRTP